MSSISLPGLSGSSHPLTISGHGSTIPSSTPSKASQESTEVLPGSSQSSDIWLEQLRLQESINNIQQLLASSKYSQDIEGIKLYTEMLSKEEERLLKLQLEASQESQRLATPPGASERQVARDANWREQQQLQQSIHTTRQLLASSRYSRDAGGYALYTRILERDEEALLRLQLAAKQI
jgi:hypothetical protein